MKLWSRFGAWALFLALALALGVLAWRPALALYQLEAGGYDLAAAESFRSAHPAADNPSLDLALRHFQQAIAFAPGDGYAYRQLGQAWLFAGNNDAARQALSRAVALRPHDPLAHLALGDAFSGLGDAEKAVAEYEVGRYGSAKDTALANYLKLADSRIGAASGDVALKILQEKVLYLDPHSLPALYRVAAIYGGMGQAGVASAMPIRDQMKRFALDSVAVPASPARAGELAQTMIALTEGGTWTREMLLNVVGYQVWQFSTGATGPGAEQLLQTLVTHWPEDADLLFDLGELYQRRGDHAAAEARYRQVLALSPDYARAALRLGMIAEARGVAAGNNGNLKDAAHWYQLYHQAAPDDLLGIRRLADVSTALGDSGEVEALKAKLSSLSDDRQIAAGLLHLPPADIALGANLLVNGDFEDWSGTAPAGWIWSDMFNRAPFAAAGFVGGADQMTFSDGHRGARVDGLWIAPLENNQEPRAGFLQQSIGQPAAQPMRVDADQVFLLSFDYWTSPVPDIRAAVWVGADSGRIWAKEPNLPPTNGRWYHFVSVAQNGTGMQTTIHPLLRSFAPGEVVFDNVQIRIIQVLRGSSLGSGQMRIWVAGHGE